MRFFRAFILPLIIVLTMVDFVFFRVMIRWFKGAGFMIYVWLIIFCVEYYSYHALRVISKNKWTLIAYITVTVLMYGSFLYFAITGEKGFSSVEFKRLIMILTLFIVPKIFLAVAMIIEDVFRMGSFIYQRFSQDDLAAIPDRRKAVAWIALGIAAIPFLAVLDGIFFGKYRYRVIRKQVFFDDLPDEFDGTTITQLSDIHSGSFDNADKVAYGINLAKEQKSDILVFTGDIVNNYYTELEPWESLFSELDAPMGMFAVLGNHDYGDYGNLSQEEKKDSIARIQKMQRNMGFQPLNNQMHTIERRGKRLNIIGVENWGASHYFPKKGDLRKATAEVKEGDFNVLLSHDPSHFDHDLDEYDNIINFSKKMHLTLSGHTHGMQFGIEIPGLIKWSPVKYRYHNWAGLYEINGRKLYVNRGFGYLAFPGRVGEWPEITVIELKKKV